MKPIAVVTTVANREDAHRLARTLVERKLAACAQISEIESIYHWQGEVQQAGELRVLFKTTDERYALVESTIRELHPYELPAIHAFAFEHVYPAYARVDRGECGRLWKGPLRYARDDRVLRSAPAVIPERQRGGPGGHANGRLLHLAAFQHPGPALLHFRPGSPAPWAWRATSGNRTDRPPCPCGRHRIRPGPAGSNGGTRLDGPVDGSVGIRHLDMEGDG